MCTLKTLMQISSILTFALFATTASAQERPSYGQEITLANAKKVANAALAEAQKNSWNVAIAIGQPWLVSLLRAHGRYAEREPDDRDRESAKRRDVPSSDAGYGRYGQQRPRIVFGYTRRHADYGRAAHHCRR
jgi:hypothetical protein